MDTTEAEQKAHDLLDGRMESVRALVRHRQHVTDLEHQAAYKTALKAGWTADELKRVGLPELDGQTRRRTNTNRSKQPTGQSADTNTGLQQTPHTRTGPPDGAPAVNPGSRAPDAAHHHAAGTRVKGKMYRPTGGP